jgi:hypothetical protein
MANLPLIIEGYPLWYLFCPEIFPTGRVQNYGNGKGGKFPIAYSDVLFRQIV